MTESWTCRHFTLANAVDDEPDNLPHLLRRVADQIDSLAISPMDLLDVTISEEITADGPWWSATVYWSPDAEETGEPTTGASRDGDPPNKDQGRSSRFRL